MIRKFTVETSHAAGAPWAGQHAFTVTRNPDGTFYAKSAVFGCGRDAPNELAAMQSLAVASAGAIENLCEEF